MLTDVAIEYEIDGQNRIATVNRAWFAEAQTAGDERLEIAARAISMRQ